MPDLFFHLSSVAYKPKKIERWVITTIILGTLIPDIIGRIPGIVSIFFNIKELRWVVPLHTPIVLILFNAIICFLFKENIRKRLFYNLNFGSFFHLFLDILQEQFYQSDYYLFYPLSLYAPKIDLFYYNDTVYLFPIASIYMIYFIKKNYSKVSNGV
jgi:hypothetical protein